MRRSIVPDPSYRRRSRRGSGRQAVVALLLLLGATGLLVAFGWFAVRSLAELPGGNVKATLAERNAEARLAAEAGRAGSGGAAEAVATPAAAIGEAGEAAPAGAGSGSDIRYVEGSGIAATRVDGPLTRAPSAVVVMPERAPEGPKPTLYRLVIIEDADTVNLRTHTIQLAHVDGPEADTTCTTAAGAKWPCGMRARTALRRFVRRRALECLDLPAPEGSPRRAACSAGGIDVSAWLVDQGWARPSDDAPDALKLAHAAAEAAGRGLYDPAGR